MPREKSSAYVCSSCGHDEPKWMGRCPSCGEWNTFKEIKGVSALAASLAVPPPARQLLADTDPTPPERFPTGIAELDRVLGGGLSPGTAILLGGEPGIGKSTLMLQVAASLPGTGLYVSGEESPGQLKTRADRLKLKQDSLEILCETDLDTLIAILNQKVPAYLVVDSIQTLVSAEAGSIPGTPNQLKIVGHRLTSWAKGHGVPLFLIAHVTKEGIIAGPKVIEHLADTVLYFDHSSTDLRILRASKNRLGSVDEAGLFQMDAGGLKPIVNPAGFFLEHRKTGPPVGSAVAAVYEGSRILLVEIQALTVSAKGTGGRVYSDRIEAARISRIAAVLERHAGLRLSDQDIYINVAGGLRICDTGAELAAALALVSARSEKALPANLAVFGEISLAGEIRAVPHMRRRAKTAVDSGLKNWISAESGDDKEKFPGMGYRTSLIKEAAAWVLSRS
ncbi:MAG: DNA repair protein RadA [Spirochaeta sp. LUC14_002_19_P3]|nr:MAG: DNA repair protein RadA [Spirochaeta sp. LUC14_002_19_P3]